MARTPTSTARQRPGGSSGPARDAGRDVRIIEAALDLIVESGYADLTMAAIAARAGVGKATVYRRWASREDLVADALESIMVPTPPPEPASGSLREDLVAALVHSSACQQPDHRCFQAILGAVAVTHHEVADTLRERYIAAQREAIGRCLVAAGERGELDAGQVAAVLGPGRLEVPAVVALLVMQEELTGGLLGVEGITRLVDDVLLPLVPAGAAR
ncbi:hypothetical protein GCM10027030_26060 [Luteococcus sediminum]